MATVCIVDDSPNIRSVLRLILEDAGHTVDEVADGAVVLDHLRGSARPLVVLLDLLMPHVDGHQLLETIAADPVLAGRHAYIVITAADHEDDERLHTVTRRLAAPLVDKPCDIDELLFAVAGAVARLPTDSGLLPHAG